MNKIVRTLQSILETPILLAAALILFVNLMMISFVDRKQDRKEAHKT